MSFSGLPRLYILEDAALFRHTVVQFLPQFYEIEDVLFGAVSPWDYFLSTNPVIVGLHLLVLWTSFTLLASIFTGNYSWTDRVWSITPTSYVTMLVVRAYYTGEGRYGMLHTRLLGMWLMYVVWTIRLTSNYYRKGGYNKGSEDYRWGVIKSNIGAFPAFLLQLFYIPLQNVLMASLAMPAYQVFLVGDEVPPYWVDYVAITILALAIFGEHMADNVQFRFQEAKKQHLSGNFTATTYGDFSATQLDRGFVTADLFKICRHPSYALEQVIWFTFYLWAAAITTDLWNYAVVGPIAIFVLFQITTRLTEAITKGKYEAYKFYQRKVGMLCPLPYCYWDWDDSKTTLDVETSSNSLESRKEK